MYLTQPLPSRAVVIVLDMFKIPHQRAGGNPFKGLRSPYIHSSRPLVPYSDMALNRALVTVICTQPQIESNYIYIQFTPFF